MKLSLAAVAALIFLPLPASAQLVQRYGFPVIPPTERSPWQAPPCYMVQSDGIALDLARLCGGTPRTVNRNSLVTSLRPRKRLAYGGYQRQYELLANTYPDENVKRRLDPDMSYTKSVCDRLDKGQSLEQIRNADIGNLQPSGSSVTDNVQKQNIEITLKAAPQYYCPEDFDSPPVVNTPRSSGGSASSGQCNYPDDIAADGSRCGNRAASVRSGGRR